MELGVTLRGKYGFAKLHIAQALGFSRKMFYHEHKMDAKDKDLAERIRQIHQDKDDTLGAVPLAAMLGVGRARVERVMDKYGIEPRPEKKSYQYPGKAAETFDNLLREDDINLEDYEIVFSDILQFKLADGSKVYSCFAIRRKTRQILSFVYGYSMPADLVVDTLSRIDIVDLSEAEVIWHSDQGKQYGAGITVDKLLEMGFTASMSRAGTPTDNAIAERFVRTFKHAVVRKYAYEAIGQFAKEAERWLNFYNQERPHRSLELNSPNEFAKNENLEIVSYLTLNRVQ